MDKIQTTLLNKFKKRQLAHFYIIKNASAYQNEHDHFFKNWIEELITQIVRSCDIPSQIQNLADVLFIEKTDSQKSKNSLVIDNFQELFQMHETKPLQMPHQFVAILHAHHLTPTVSNKLLKILEEPRNHMTIFLSNPKSQNLLATIESRALNIRLAPPTDNQKRREIAAALATQFKNQILLSEFLAIHKGTPVEILFETVLEQNFDSDYLAYQKLLKQMQEHQEAKVYYGQAQTYLTHLYYFLDKHFKNSLLK